MFFSNEGKSNGQYEEPLNMGEEDLPFKGKA